MVSLRINTKSSFPKNSKAIFDKQYKEFISVGGEEKDWKTMLYKNPIDILDN